MLCYCRQHSHSTWNSCSTFHDHGWITRLVSFVLNLVDSRSSRSYPNSSASFFLYYLLRIGFLKIKLKYLTQSSFFSARVVGELPECTQENMTEITKNFFQHFKVDPATVKSNVSNTRRWQIRMIGGEKF